MLEKALPFNVSLTIPRASEEFTGTFPVQFVKASSTKGSASSYLRKLQFHTCRKSSAHEKSMRPMLTLRENFTKDARSCSFAVWSRSSVVCLSFEPCLCVYMCACVHECSMLHVLGSMFRDSPDLSYCHRRLHHAPGGEEAMHLTWTRRMQQNRPPKN